jgi:hypothetical protein
MGDKDSVLSLDGLGAYPAAYASYQCAHVFTTDAVPATRANAYHESMALDSFLSRDADNVPILAPFYYYALTVPVP